MLTITFENEDVLTIPETAIANFKALGITNTLMYKHGHWLAGSVTQAVALDLYIEQLEQLKTAVNSIKPTSDKTALDSLRESDYQIISFQLDQTQPVYVTWHSAENDESVNKNQNITTEKTPQGEVLRITIMNENE